MGNEPAAVADLSARRRRYDVSRRALAAAAGVVLLAGGGVAAWQLTSGGGGCVASAGCHSVELVASGRDAAVLTVRAGTVTMRPTGVAAAPAGEVYVLWQQPRDGRPTALRTFDITASQPVTAQLRAPYADTQLFGVSLESAATAPPPTPSNIVASGNAA